MGELWYFHALEHSDVGRACSRRADAITRAADDTEYFVEPLAEEMTMTDLLQKLRRG